MPKSKSPVRCIDLPGTNVIKGIESMLKAAADSEVVYRSKAGLVTIDPARDEVVMPLTPEGLISVVNQVGETGSWVFDAKAGVSTFEFQAPTVPQAKLCLAYKDLYKFIPSFERMVNVPMLTLNSSGGVETLTKGCHSGMYINSKATLRHIPIEDAPKVVLSAFKAVRFETVADASRAIAALMTPALRQLYPDMISPIHVYSAVHQSSGKGYLCRITPAIYRDKSENITFEGGKKSNPRETFIGALTAGKRFICLDNVKDLGDTSTIESAITEDSCFGRAAYGANATHSVKGVHMSMTANHELSITVDMLTRSNVISIGARGAGDEDIGIFGTEDKIDDAVANDILSAMYSIITHWVYAGKTMGPKTNRFDIWSKAMNHIVTTYFGLPLTNEGHDTAKGNLSASPELKWLSRMGKHLTKESPVAYALSSELCTLMDQVEDIPWTLYGNPERALSHVLRKQISDLATEPATVGGIVVSRNRVKRSNGNYKEGWKFERIEVAEAMSFKDMEALIRDIVSAQAARLRGLFHKPTDTEVVAAPVVIAPEKVVEVRVDTVTVAVEKKPTFKKQPIDKTPVPEYTIGKTLTDF